MPLSGIMIEGMDQHFIAVAVATGAGMGDGGYYRGIFHDTPFLLKKTSSETPGYFFKFRKKPRLTKPGQPPPMRVPLAPQRPGAQAPPKLLPLQPSPRTPAWQETVPEEHREAGISCEVEDDYIFLWIDHPLKLTPEDIASLAEDCARAHAAILPDQTSCCMNCGGIGEGTLVQSNASVAILCPDCLEQKHEAHAAAVEKLNASDAKVSFLLPLALLGGGIGWSVFWNAYDAFFRMAHGRVFIPIWIVGAVVAAVGFGVGWPIGKLLHRSGAVKRFSPRDLAITSAIAIIASGELIYASWAVYRVTGNFDLGLALRCTLPFMIGDNLQFALIKLIFAVTLAFAIHELSKSKTKNFRL